jgi:hypothetical protein
VVVVVVVAGSGRLMLVGRVSVAGGLGSVWGCWANTVVDAPSANHVMSPRAKKKRRDIACLNILSSVKNPLSEEGHDNMFALPGNPENFEESRDASFDAGRRTRGCTIRTRDERMLLAILSLNFVDNALSGLLKSSC